MSNQAEGIRRAASRLLEALEPDDTVTCTHAEAQLPALVEAEFAGINVDRQPEFADVLRHLDHCADCMALYSKLSEDMEAIVGASETLPQESLSAPSPFAPQRQSEGVLLRVLGTLQHAFELALTPQMPAPATLSTSERVNIFADHLDEVGSRPFVAVTLVREQTHAEVIVAIRDATSGRWQVHLDIGGTQWSAITDGGIARFSDVPVGSLHALTLLCVQLSTEQQHD